MNRVNAAVAGLIGMLGAAWVRSRYETDDSGSVHDVPLLGGLLGLVDGAYGAAMNPDIQTMRASSALRDQLKRHEGGPLLTRTNLGDGGWTIGYGRFEKYEHLLPARISLMEAEAMLDVDIDRRGAHWVRAYVTVPLSQEQFDALTSMAFNLKPSSFRQIAEAVNRGEAPDQVALRFVRAGSQFERGLRNRRGGELALFHRGVYNA